MIKKNIFVIILLILILFSFTYSYAWMKNLKTEAESLIVDYDNNNLFIDENDVIYKLYCYEISNEEIENDCLIANLYPGRIINFKLEITNNSFRNHLININLDNFKIPNNSHFLDYLSFYLMNDSDYQLTTLDLIDSDNMLIDNQLIYNYPILDNYLIKAKENINIYFTLEFSINLPKSLSNSYFSLGHFNLIYYDENN